MRTLRRVRPVAEPGKIAAESSRLIGLPSKVLSVLQERGPFQQAAQEAVLGGLERMVKSFEQYGAGESGRAILGSEIERMAREFGAETGEPWPIKPDEKLTIVSRFIEFMQRRKQLQDNVPKRLL